jgi:hypothetical protein
MPNVESFGDAFNFRQTYFSNLLGFGKALAAVFGEMRMDEKSFCCHPA